MMKNTLALLLLIFGTALYAQVDRNKLDPKVTEVWEHEPRVVTPGDGTAPPSDAIVLFDGKNLDEWVNKDGQTPQWKVGEGAVTVVKGTGSMISKREFGDMQLHIEFRTPDVVEGKGQGRGNSGIFLQSRYEVQVLDSYENRTYSNGQAASIYKQRVPLVNACRKPGEWQTYDIIYTAPRFGEKGRVIVPARVTVIQNGILVQNNTEILGGTEFKGLPIYKEHGKAPISLQDHSNPVSYRNIWVREL